MNLLRFLERTATALHDLSPTYAWSVNASVNSDCVPGTVRIVLSTYGRVDPKGRPEHFQLEHMVSRTRMAQSALGPDQQADQLAQVLAGKMTATIEKARAEHRAGAGR